MIIDITTGKRPGRWCEIDSTIGKDLDVVKLISVGIFSEIIKKSKTILWNEPMGVFEMEKFQNGTKSITLTVAEATGEGAFSLLGGGDSVAAVNKFNLADKLSYVSTGGGALLEYFEGKILPGIEAIGK